MYTPQCYYQAVAQQENDNEHATYQGYLSSSSLSLVPRPEITLVALRTRVW